MRVKKALGAALCGLFLLSCVGLTAQAQEATLPDGSVEGLPSKLTVMDEQGRSVNEQGEYFFVVEDMHYGTTYTKNIQIMNLREDATYHIYFYVEPLYKDGEIDLEEGCTCVFSLDDEQIYSGTVTGDGTRQLTRENPVDLGLYEPGDSHKLRAEITWNELSNSLHVDNGDRLVSKDGEAVLVGPNGEGHAEGEIEFKWIFYAHVDGEETDNAVDTGLLSVKNSFWLACIGIASLMVIVMLILLKRKQKKDKEKTA
ncbi:MAG TPA: hypothetical protein DCO72_04725 [Ruminococcus sp.]|nr:hypothetical protein [Ruminococcus sp.]